MRHTAAEDVCAFLRTGGQRGTPRPPRAGAGAGDAAAERDGDGLPGPLRVRDDVADRGGGPGAAEGPRVEHRGLPVHHRLRGRHVQGNAGPKAARGAGADREGWRARGGVRRRVAGELGAGRRAVDRRQVHEGARRVRARLLPVPERRRGVHAARVRRALRRLLLAASAPHAQQHLPQAGGRQAPLRGAQRQEGYQHRALPCDPEDQVAFRERGPREEHPEAGHASSHQDGLHVRQHRQRQRHAGLRPGHPPLSQPSPGPPRPELLPQYHR